MSLLSRFRETVRALFGPTSEALPKGQDMLAGVLQYAQAPRRGTRELLEAYRRLPFFHTICRRIAEDVAGVPWQVYAPASRRRGKAFYRSLASVPEHMRTARVARAVKEGELRLLEEHPLLKLLGTMNPALGPFDSWVVTQLHLDIIGQAPMMRDNNPVGQPLQLWPVPPHWVAEVPSATAPMYRVSYGAWYRDLAEADMVWLRVPDPEYPYGRGTSYGTAVADELDVDELRARYAKNFFYNDATPAALITLKNAAEPEAKRFHEMLNERHRGPGRNGTSLVTNREVSYQQLQPPMRELQFAELHPAGRNLLMQVLQFPVELLGMREGTNRATIRSAEYLYFRGVVVPRKNRQLAFMQPLLAEYDERLLLSYENPVPEDLDAQREHMRAIPTTVRVNEHRLAQGQEPLEGEEGDALYTPPAPAPSFGPLALAAGQDPAWVEELKGLDRRQLRARRARFPTAAAAEDGSQRCPDWKACDPLHVEDFPCSENPVRCCECRLELGCHFEPQPLLCRACRASGKAVLRATAAALEALRPEALTVEVGPVEEAGFEGFGSDALRKVGVDVAFNMRNPLVRQRLEKYGGERIRLITDTTRVQLREELAAGISAGEGINELKKRVEEVFDAAEGYRAERIARTEAVGLSNAANVEAWRQSEVVEGKEWLSVRDGATRDSHRDMDGQVVALDASFTTPSGLKAEHPGGFGVAEEDVNCRCTALPKVYDKAGPLSEEQKQAAWKAFDEALATYEEEIRKAFVRGFQTQRKAVLAAL